MNNLYDITKAIKDYNIDIDTGLSLDEIREGYIFSIEQKLHHEDLRKERRSIFFLTSPFGQIATTEYGSITDINYSAMSLFGYTNLEDIKYKDIKILFDKTGFEQYSTIIQQVKKQGKISRCIPMLFKHNLGHLIQVRGSINLVEYEQSAYFIMYLKCRELHEGD